MSETDLYAQILLAYSRNDCRLFRTNSGFAWQGTVIEHTPMRLILAHPRPIRLGVPGMADINGWSTGAIYTAIEVKSQRGRVTPEQQSFIELVRRSGGRAGIARSVEDAGVILTGKL